MVPPVGARIERTLSLDEAAIRAGAEAVGDANPLHHDAAYAARSRFGGLIASGAHTSALLCALVTQGFGTPDPDDPGAVGVDYQVRFTGPVRAAQPLSLAWWVVSHEQRRSGTMVRLEGRMAEAQSGVPLVEGKMTVLYFGS